MIQLIGFAFINNNNHLSFIINQERMNDSNLNHQFSFR